VSATFEKQFPPVTGVCPPPRRNWHGFCSSAGVPNDDNAAPAQKPCQFRRSRGRTGRVFEGLFFKGRAKHTV